MGEFGGVKLGRKSEVNMRPTYRLHCIPLRMLSVDDEGLAGTI
jgi:hypothetical protein